MSERRKFIRLESSINLRCTPITKDLPTFETTSRNISMGGIRTILKDKFAIGTKVRLEITLPNEARLIVILGEIVWQQAEDAAGQTLMDTGIKYLDVDTPDMQKFNSYLLNCLKTKLQKTRTTADETAQKISKLTDFLSQEIRLPGDSSPTMKAPDFLIHEVNLPGDKIRYCRIKTSMLLKYKLGNDEVEHKSIGQYLSSTGAWLLLEEQLPKNTPIELTLELPAKPAQNITAKGRIAEANEQILCDDNQIKIYYETKIDFTQMDMFDRKKIIRYIYECRKDYIMLGKKLPPGWV